MVYDVVYALGRGSFWNDNELRYSLRSIQRFLKGYNKVWIIGNVPRFPVRNLNYIAFLENGRYPSVNIKNKILTACRSEHISDKFIFFNDDHFLLKEFEAQEFPYYYCGDLKDVRNATNYMHTVENTVAALTAAGHPTKNFDTHTPIVYDKKLFKSIMAQYDWSVQHGLCIKSLYCNTLGMRGMYAEDGKMYRGKNEEQLRHWLSHHDIFSIGDECLNHLLKNRFPIIYPTKSKYES